jgi:hypothetical protein
MLRPLYRSQRLLRDSNLTLLRWHLPPVSSPTGRILLYSTNMAQPTPAHPVASSSQNIQISALESPHADVTKAAASSGAPEKPKKKDKKAELASQYPLEVRRLFLCARSGADPARRFAQLQPPPEFFEHRIKMWDQLKSEHVEFLKGALCAILGWAVANSRWCAVQPNRVRISRLPCLTAQSARERAGTRLQWTSRKRSPRALLTGL